MRVYTSVCSGGRFPVQLALMCECYNIFKLPDLMLGSSGGNLCNYIALAGDFSPEGIERICNRLNSNLFSHSWFPKYLNFMPSWIVGTFKSSIYKPGEGDEELLNDIFTPYNITRIEIFSGTMECSTGKHQAFCNKSKEDSILSKASFDANINNCLEHIYVNGNIETIAKVCTASCSIPVYLPPKSIGNNKYLDGGSVFFSPLTPLVDSLDSLMEDNIEGLDNLESDLHIDYFNCRDLESNLESDVYFNIVQSADIAFNRLMRTLAVQDRLSGIQLIKRDVYRNRCKLLYFEGRCTKEVLGKIEKAFQVSENTAKIRSQILGCYRPSPLKKNLVPRFGDL